MDHAIRIQGLHKTFRTRRCTRAALSDIDIAIAPGEMVALIGSSGSGKSTLLRHCSGLIAGDRGRIEVFGRSVQADGRLAHHLRDLRSGVGMVFQQFNLVNRLSVLTNVLAGMIHRLPSWRSLSMRFTRMEKQQALGALARVGMVEYAEQRAGTLSGGQQQRAALARCLVQQARIILGDEPIASLDPQSARTVMEELAQINREDGTTVVVSLHQIDYALEFCPRTIALADGRVVYDGPSAALDRDRLSDIYRAEPETAPCCPPARPAPRPVLEPALV